MGHSNRRYALLELENHARLLHTRAQVGQQGRRPRRRDVGEANLGWC